MTPKYSADRVEALAAVFIDSPALSVDRIAAEMLRAYAATLRPQARVDDAGTFAEGFEACEALHKMAALEAALQAQPQARVDNEMVDRGIRAFAEQAGYAPIIDERNRRCMRAAIEAALQAQPAAERQGADKPAAWALRFWGIINPDELCAINTATTFPSEDKANEYADRCTTPDVFSRNPKRPIVVPLYTHSAAPVGVPDGWVLVPVDPTREMQAAGGHVNSEWLNDNAPMGENRYGGPVMRSVWEAMLSAAPPAPHDAQGDGV